MNSSDKSLDCNIKPSILKKIWHTLHQSNPFVQSCQILGKAVDVINNQNPDEEPLPAETVFSPEVITKINRVNSPHLLDVATKE